MSIHDNIQDMAVIQARPSFSRKTEKYSVGAEP